MHFVTLEGGAQKIKGRVIVVKGYGSESSRSVGKVVRQVCAELYLTTTWILTWNSAHAVDTRCE